MVKIRKNITAIIVASGVGSRMGSEIPKQYLTINHKTVLEHSITPFLAHKDISKVVVAISQADTFFEKLAIKNDKISVVFGGETRAKSVFNALKILSDDDFVLIHDGARPCIIADEIDCLLAYCDDNGAILSLPSVDTLKKVYDQSIVGTVDRSEIFRALTPQLFQVGLLKKAILQCFENNIEITDDASAMEHLGYNPKIVIGESSNIKITYPSDLALAEFYLQRNNNDKNW